MAAKGGGSGLRWERIKLVLSRMTQKDVRRQKIRNTRRRLLKHHGVRPTKPQDWQLARGDTVEVLRGRDEGKQGKILRVYRRGEVAVIDGINLRLKKTKGSAGEIVTKFAPSPVLIKNLALVDSETNLPTKIEWKYQQTAIDTERYQRVRQSIVSGDIIGKPKETKPRRKVREVHPDKDTPARLANIRTWIGPWQFFTDDQKEFIIEDSKLKIDLPNLENKLPELMYNNVEEVQEYIRMLPYCPHTFFKPGNCAPYFYEKPQIPKWSKRRMKKEIKLEDGKRELEENEELREQLETYKDRWSTFPIYLFKKIDPNHHWPRVKPEIDPKFKQFHSYLRKYCDEDKVMELLEEQRGKYDNDVIIDGDDEEEEEVVESDEEEGDDVKIEK